MINPNFIFPSLQVRVGTNLEFMVGNLTYSEVTADQNLPVNIIAGVTGAAFTVAVVLTVVVVALLLIHWSKTNKM